MNLGQRGAGIGHHSAQASLQGADFGIQLDQVIQPLADQLGPDCLIGSHDLAGGGQRGGTAQVPATRWYPG